MNSDDLQNSNVKNALKKYTKQQSSSKKENLGTF